MIGSRAQLLATLVVAGFVQAGTAAAQSQQQAPIVLAREGAFEAGGKVISGDKGTLSCDHGYVEYQIPVDARAVALFLWHSSSAKVWQNRWDGGEGFQSIFLRRGFPVYMWDGPRVGRGNWSCETHYLHARARSRSAKLRRVAVGHEISGLVPRRAVPNQRCQSVGTGDARTL